MLVALALAAPGEPIEVRDYRSHVDQAQFFLRKGWYEDARLELERAVGSPDGALDGAAWNLLAEVRYHLGDIEGALFAADRAHTHSDSEAELELAAGFSQWLQANFGVVQVGTRFDGVRSTVEIELTSLVLDPELKAYLAELGARMAVTQTLPVQFGLPRGSYRINGRELTVEAGSRGRVRIPVRGAPAEPLQVTELELSAGVAAWAGAKGRFPGPHLRFGVTQPLGGFVVGLAADWSPAPFQTPDGVGFSAADLGAAVHAGVEAARIRDAVVRAELSGRVARVGGVGFPCDGGDGAFACGGSARPLLWAAPPGWAVVPGVELSALAVDRRRRVALGWGVRVIGEAAIGRRPASGDGAVGSEGFTWTLAESDRGFVWGGVRVLGTVVWAR